MNPDNNPDTNVDPSTNDLTNTDPSTNPFQFVIPKNDTMDPNNIFFPQIVQNDRELVGPNHSIFHPRLSQIQPPQIPLNPLGGLHKIKYDPITPFEKNQSGPNPDHHRPPPM